MNVKAAAALVSVQEEKEIDTYLAVSASQARSSISTHVNDLLTTIFDSCFLCIYNNARISTVFMFIFYLLMKLINKVYFIN